MNPDPFQDLEDRLRALPRCGPSAGLDARIAALRAGAPERPAAVAPRRPGRPALWAAAALALAGCLGAVLAARLWNADGNGVQPGPLAQPPRAAPDGDAPGTVRRDQVQIEQVWSAVSPGEVVAEEGAPPVQRFERRVVRHVQVIDASRHVRIEWKIPRRETVELPLEYN